MHSSRFCFPFVVLTLAACSPAVDLGGPRTDSGAPPESTEDGGMVASGDSSTPTVSSDASAADGASDPLQGLNQAESYASGNVACVTASDCCVVFDGCMDIGLVVGAADKDTVASLLESYDQAEINVAHPQCLGCIPPPTQVACIQNKCTGAEVGSHDMLPDGGIPDQALFQNHCGVISGTPETTQVGQSVLGC